MDSFKWVNSIYKPTPTIIEAAQALYEGHSVKEISRSDSGAENLTKTADAINNIIEKSKKDKIKSICFVTGVPGLGKTLAGLNLANKQHEFSEQEHAVFLSGNGPLVEVLQEALARNKVHPKNWFLNPKDDVRSSYFLEYVATEFDIQGLELDWICIGWDADFRFLNQGWNYYQFRGKDWQKIRDVESMLYLKNTYRVLLTRARQGLIIFIPKGEENDPTRIPLFYDETYEYLRGIGLKEIIG